MTIENKDIIYSSILPFSLPYVSSYKRIGPHNYEALCIMIGSLLGNGTMEKKGNGYKISFYKWEHIEYILWLHRKLLEHGYCKDNLPSIQTKIIHNKWAYYCQLRSFTYSSFDWIYEGFYGKDKKRVPLWIDQYLSPTAIAIWIMDDGTSIKNKGIKLCTNAFPLSDIKRLASILESKYNLKVAIHSAGPIDQYNIYFPKSSLPILIPLISPYMQPYFLHKLNMVKTNL
jgi:LAGLIDADG DNA endonuclease family